MLAADQASNYVHVYQPDETEGQQRAGEDGWFTRISDALSEDRFHLFAQRVAPVSDPENRAQSAYEILLRLETAGGDLLPPIRFFPAVERCRLMPQVDHWVIRHTLQALAPHLREAVTNNGAGPRYAINLSAASLADEGLVGFIVEQLDETGVPPASICFEIAEPVALAQLPQATALAKKLVAHGCRFALDHFHSSVGGYGYLQELPIDYVKIDGRFIKGMMSDRMDCAVVEGVSRIGRTLKIETVAECAESSAIMSKLKDLGVGHAQGYVIHRPEPLLDALEGQGRALGAAM